MQNSTPGARPVTPAPEATETDFELGVEGFTYRDLYDPARLRDLTARFHAELERDDAALHAALLEYGRARGAGLKGTRAESELLIAAAPHLSRFVARLFRVEPEREAHAASIRAQDAVFEFKNFIARRAVKRVPAEKALTYDIDALHAALDALRRAAFADTLGPDDELGVARMTARLLAWEKLSEKGGADGAAPEIGAARAAAAGAGVALAEFEGDAVGHGPAAGDDARFVKGALRLVETWASVHATRGEAHERVKGWVSFRAPHPLDYEHLVQLERSNADLPEMMRGLDKNLRRRDGFALTDPRATRREVLDEVNYCLFCHERD